MKYLGIPVVSTIALTLSACAATNSSNASNKPQDISEVCSQLVEKNTANNVAVATSKPVSANENLPAYCQITGKIEPNIGFEARFPVTDWNGKYYQAGCGGFCGKVVPNRETHSNAINHALRRGYATITTDAGHEGLHIGDGSWALDNPEAEEVYAHTTLPLTLEAGHQLIEALYKKQPEYSYFSGCSNGGRMGAIAAQRYPDLFDGIISGCPVLNLSINGGAFGAWVLQTNAKGEGERYLDHKFTPKLALLEGAVLAQCDKVDGEVDDIISKPDECDFNLDVIPICETASSDCLTKEERSVVEKWYQGPTTSDGTDIFFGMPVGSERFWGHWYLGSEKMSGPGTFLADGYGKYLGFPEDPKGYSAQDFNFDTDVTKLATQGELLNALNPDLSAFKKAGGKMIMWHGMSDALVIPNQSPVYYESVEAKMGGKSAVDPFYRLFMAPGLGHCWDKPASTPDQMSMLEALENWVEKGTAPDVIPVTQYDEDGSVSRRGKLKPYPLEATYSTPAK